MKTICTIVATAAFTLVLEATAGVHPLLEKGTAPPARVEEHRGKVLILEVCPDNTCDAFQGTSGIDSRVLYDFAFLYLYELSDYAVLDEWRKLPAVQDALAAITDRNRYKNCRYRLSNSQIRCNLLELGKRHEIRSMWLRYDEKRRSVTSVNLRKAVGAKEAEESRKSAAK